MYVSYVARNQGKCYRIFMTLYPMQTCMIFFKLIHITNDATIKMVGGGKKETVEKNQALSNWSKTGQTWSKSGKSLLIF
jgi:hypothetical protein